MLGTAVNCIAMQDALEQLGLDARTMSAVPMHRFAETYVTADAVRHLQAGRVVLFACGIGCPAFSTDTTAALRAIEIGADAILLAKNIDGVYDDDPHINPAAKRLDDLTYEEAQRRNLKVMDEAAFILCKENNVQAVRVFGLDDPENIVRVAQGERLGSVVHPNARFCAQSKAKEFAPGCAAARVRVALFKSRPFTVRKRAVHSQKRIMAPQTHIKPAKAKHLARFAARGQLTLAKRAKTRYNVSIKSLQNRSDWS